MCHQPTLELTLHTELFVVSLNLFYSFSGLKGAHEESKQQKY